VSTVDKKPRFYIVTNYPNRRMTKAERARREFFLSLGAKVVTPDQLPKPKPASFWIDEMSNWKPDGV